MSAPIDPLVNPSADPLAKPAGALAGNRTAIIVMLLAMACFILNDTMAKLASDDMGTGQVIFIRGLIASPIMMLIAWWKWKGAFRQPARIVHKSVLWRTAGEVIATALYLTALFNMPIANATAILQTVPLATTAGAALLLGEQVGIRRWSAIGIGFAGVLLIVRPGSDGFTIWSLFALGSVGAILLRDLSSRVLPEGTPVLGVAALSAVAVTLLGAVMTLFDDWQPVSAGALFYLTCSALFLLGAYNFILLAMRSGDGPLSSRSSSLASGRTG